MGHSLGGLIIRAALPYLQMYKTKIKNFVTLSTPHLGYAAHSSAIINTAIWIFKKWSNSSSLNQLSLTDTKDVRKSFLYQMSSFPGLSWFSNVILVSSKQDTYAPYDSARIEVGPKAQ